MNVRANRREAIAALTALGAVGLGWPLAAAAQAAYPSRPVRLIVPFPAGSATDLVGRLIGQKLSEELGQPFVIDNRAGAGGNIGSQMIANAAPDGYTVGMGVFGVHAINPHLFKNMPFDSISDFQPIGCISTAIQVLVVNSKIPVNTLQEFIDYARARPTELNFASPGNGSTGQLAASLLESTTGIKMTNVPFTGAAAARASLLAGDTQVTFELVTTAVPHVKSGALKALAVTGARRSPALPQLPTFMESGFKTFEVTTWMSLIGPAGLPAAIVEKLNKTINTILARPEVVKALDDAGTTAAPSTPAELRQRMERDRTKWGEIIRKAGTKID
ncbi:Bug family tripartite tricarboxylate transporter substrate binding protein [Ottowia thiooxydans]|uniref:Bug family tripartite tricarboxylate transporter substrate binding protein n=1 Tax=Ottowia thiooxydans TaxID=219182 RepID=UPI00048AA8CF|nr:tripartite tricarboxylate transporter substrate binding protein [Ottowia thiooxydans]